MRKSERKPAIYSNIENLVLWVRSEILGSALKITEVSSELKFIVI